MMKSGFLFVFLSSLIVPAHGQTAQLPGASGGPYPVVDWNGKVQLPDDILFIPHGTPAVLPPALFLVTLDGRGAVQEATPLDGFSPYLERTIVAIKAASFPARYAAQRIVVREPDPELGVLLPDSQPPPPRCSEGEDLRALYQKGLWSWWRSDRVKAAECYEYILKRNPSSVAARYGRANLCRERHDQCDVEYLDGLVTTNPDFYEAKLSLAFARGIGPQSRVAALRSTLGLNLPLETRIGALQFMIVDLDNLHEIDDEVEAIRQWTEANQVMQQIHREDELGLVVNGLNAGLREEGRQKYLDALRTYRMADLAAARSGGTPKAYIFEVELGEVRALKHTGDVTQSEAICSRLKSQVAGVARDSRESGGEREEFGAMWEFSCGNTANGLQTISNARAKHPKSCAPYDALEEYYYSIGEFEKARQARATSDELYQAWSEQGLK
jgi:hypothetical protein